MQWISIKRCEWLKNNIKHLCTRVNLHKKKYLQPNLKLEAWQKEVPKFQLNKNRKVTKNWKTTHMWRRWCTPQNFFFAFIDQLEKQIQLLKNCWSGPVKNKIILIFIVTLQFFKKIKKNICRYNYQNLDDVIYSSWDIKQNILTLVILGCFLPFLTSLKTPKIKILKNEKICWRYHHFTNVYQKSQSYDVWFLRYRVRDRHIFSF